MCVAQGVRAIATCSFACCHSVYMEMVVNFVCAIVFVMRMDIHHMQHHLMCILWSTILRPGKIYGIVLNVILATVVQT